MGVLDEAEAIVRREFARQEGRGRMSASTATCIDKKRCRHTEPGQHRLYHFLRNQTRGKRGRIFNSFGDLKAFLFGRIRGALMAGATPQSLGLDHSSSPVQIMQQALDKIGYRGWICPVGNKLKLCPRL